MQLPDDGTNFVLKRATKQRCTWTDADECKMHIICPKLHYVAIYVLKNDYSIRGHF